MTPNCPKCEAPMVLADIKREGFATVVKIYICDVDGEIVERRP